MDNISRRTETRTYIKQALGQLLKEKTFEEISVTMICRQAGINRGTFYLHYLDKYDMIDKMKSDTLSQIYAIITEDTEALTREVIFKALTYIYNDFDFIATLATSTYVNLPLAIRGFISSILDNVPNYDQIIDQSYIVPEQYAITAYIASIEAIISKWIADGGKESPREMAEIVFHFSNKNKEDK